VTALRTVVAGLRWSLKFENAPALRRASTLAATLGIQNVLMSSPSVRQQ